MNKPTLTTVQDKATQTINLFSDITSLVVNAGGTLTPDVIKQVDVIIKRANFVHVEGEPIVRKRVGPGVARSCVVSIMFEYGVDHDGIPNLIRVHDLFRQSSVVMNRPNDAFHQRAIHGNLSHMRLRGIVEHVKTTTSKQTGLWRLTPEAYASRLRGSAGSSDCTWPKLSIAHKARDLLFKLLEPTLKECNLMHSGNDVNVSITKMSINSEFEREFNLTSKQAGILVNNTRSNFNTLDKVYFVETIDRGKYRSRYRLIKR